MKYKFILGFLILMSICFLPVICAQDVNQTIGECNGNDEIVDINGYDSKIMNVTSDSDINQNINESTTVNNNSKVEFNVTVKQVHVDLDSKKTTCQVQFDWNWESDLGGYRIIIKDANGKNVCGCLAKHGSSIKNLDFNSNYTVLKEYHDEDCTLHSNSEKLSFNENTEIPLSYDVSVFDEYQHKVIEMWTPLTPDGASLVPINPIFNMRLSTWNSYVGDGKKHYLKYDYDYKDVKYIFTKTITFSKTIIHLSNPVVKDIPDSSTPHHVQIEFDVKENVTGKFKFDLHHEWVYDNGFDPARYNNDIVGSGFGTFSDGKLIFEIVYGYSPIPDPSSSFYVAYSLDDNAYICSGTVSLNWV